MNGDTTMNASGDNALPRYSAALVGMVRALDAAEMAVRSSLWHFDWHATEPHEPMQDELSVACWACRNVEALDDALPALRALFREMVAAENVGVEIHSNQLGDACAPEFVLALLDPLRIPTIRTPKGTETHVTALTELPNAIKAQVGDTRVVYWDGEVFIIADNIPDSFVEVWFRRSMGSWDDGGAYPLRLEQRCYGWQAFGIER